MKMTAFITKKVGTSSAFLVTSVKPLSGHTYYLSLYPGLDTLLDAQKMFVEWKLSGLNWEGE